MSVSIGFKLNSIAEKEKVNDILEKVMKETNLNKSDSLVYVIDYFNKERIKDNVLNPDEYIPPNVQDTLDEVKTKGCNFITFIDNSFWCYETFNKNKKAIQLGIEPSLILTQCNMCIKGKQLALAKKLQDERRKESIKKLIQFAKQFMTITERGFLATSYLCICDSLEGDLIFSRNGKTLKCPLLENDIINIQDVCMTALNPSTQTPPCQYLVTLEHLVNLTKEDLETMNLELPVFDFDESIQQNQNQDQEDSKKVQASYKILESEENE